MDANKILNADILDIIFEGRNKEYGAYELRKTYKRRLFIAIGCMLALIALAFLGSAFSNKKGANDNKPLLVQDVQLEKVVEEQKKPEPPPPPPPPKVEPPKVEITKFTPPKVVKDEEVKPEEKPPEQEKLVDTKIGTINQEGIKTDIVAPPVEKSTGVVEAPKAVVEDYDKEFKTVQIQAKYPGGLSAWTKFLERNLNSSVPVDNGAPPAKYTVVVSFLVDKNGNISEIQALNDPGYGTAQEAVRVLKKSPQWTPAVQNGRNVIYRQKQPITFVVTDS